MKKIYAYVRVSTKQQKVQRQIANILEEYPQIEKQDIYVDHYTGTTLNRKNWQRLYNKVKADDTIVFDEVSRLSRNAKEGFEIYQELYNRGVNLVFLKEPHINTDTYKADLKAKKVELTDTDLDLLLNGLNDYLMSLVKRQIKIAFEQAQKERDLLSQRIKEGMANSDKDPGIEKGRKLTTQKAKEKKPLILQSSKDFNGTMTDKELMDSLGLSRNTFYKYKKELKVS